MMTVREEQVLCKLHEFIDANDINCAEDVTQRDSISEQCVAGNWQKRLEEKKRALLSCICLHLS